MKSYHVTVVTLVERINTSPFSMNWIKILGIGKYILLSIFIIIFIDKKFNIIENYEMIKKVWIFDLSSLVVFLYFIVYLLQKWLLVKAKKAENQNSTPD